MTQVSGAGRDVHTNRNSKKISERRTPCDADATHKYNISDCNKEIEKQYKLLEPWFDISIFISIKN